MPDSLNEVPANRAVVLRNVTCIYCGCSLTRKTRTKEHVIGRRFVPKGKLEAAWNLIAFACGACNGKKADLEDDISAVTLLPAIGEENVNGEEAISKASKSFSRRTGKRVADSHESHEVHGSLGPRITATRSFVSPPQVQRERLFELARYQMTAFCYFLTYDEQIAMGRIWAEGFHPFSHANRPDWGNLQIRAFAEAAASWDPWLTATTAQGHFQCWLRKHPNEDCWAWALEWNKNARLIGFAGNRAIAQALVNTFPEPPNVRSWRTGNTITRYWRETPLQPDEDDPLFSPARSGNT